MIKIGNQQMLREINISTLLHTIFEHGPISRVELSRKTKLSPTTVSVLIEEMIREQFVHEIGVSGSGVGRKMTLLNIRPDGGYLIGVDLSTSPPNAVLLDLNGKMIASRDLKPLYGEEEFRKELAPQIEQFIREQQVPHDHIKRIGISLPGRLDDTQTVVTASRFLNLTQFPLVRVLKEALPFPILMRNDLDAAGFAERFSGAAKGEHSIIFLMIGYGTGAGLVLNGEIYHGSSGAAGRTPFFAPYCTPILAERLKREHPDRFSGLSNEEIVHAYADLALAGTAPFKDEVDAMIADVADYSGKILQMINPQKMILGGWMTHHPALFERLVSEIQVSENSPYGPTPVVVRHWQQFGAALGAAMLGLHEIFKQKTVQ